MRPGHRSNQRLLHSQYISDASAAVNSGMLAKQLACWNVSKNDSVPAPAFRGHANHARDEKIDVPIRPITADYIHGCAYSASICIGRQ
jgi:hypothetical protein